MTVMERILGTLRAFAILGLIGFLAVGTAIVIMQIMVVVKYHTEEPAPRRPINFLAGIISNEPEPAPVTEGEISAPNSAAQSEPKSLWEKIERRVAVDGEAPADSLVVRKLYHLWYIVPVQYFQGPGEEGEYSKEVLSYSLTMEQMDAIFEYYDEAAWDPALAHMLYSFAKQQSVEQEARRRAIVDTIMINGVANEVHVMGYSPPKDEYFVAIRRHDKWWQVLGVDGTGNVIPYIDVFPPWINHPRRPRYEVENLMIAWMGATE